MSSSMLGINILEVEVTNISTFGIWLLVRDEEHFLSYDEFPWFKDQPVKSIFNVQEESLGHFYWPDMDVDLSIDNIKNPEKYPLVFK